jgi:cell division protease FtsH
MVKALGHVAYEEERSPFLAGAPVMPGPREYSEDTARQIDVAVREFVGKAYDKALGILTRERALLERGAKQLLEKETLAEAELVEYREAIARGPAGESRRETSTA